MEKKEIIQYIFQCLSDIDIQKRIWQRGEVFDTYCSSFGESVNSLDDFNFFDDVKDREFHFSNEFYAELDIYLSELLDYEENDQMLNDDQWLKLTEKAKNIYEILSDHPW